MIVADHAVRAVDAECPALSHSHTAQHRAARQPHDRKSGACMQNRVALMFAATAEACGGDSARTPADVSAAIMRPCTVSVQHPEQAFAVLPLLGLPQNVYDRIFIRRGVLDVYADTPPPPSGLPLCARGGLAELPEWLESGGTTADGRGSHSGAVSAGSDGVQEVTGRSTARMAHMHARGLAACSGDVQHEAFGGAGTCMQSMHAWAPASQPCAPAEPPEFAMPHGFEGFAGVRMDGFEAECAELLKGPQAQLEDALDDMSPDLCEKLLAEMVADGGIEGFI